MAAPARAATARPVAKWVLRACAKQRTDAEFELVDLADFNLPHLDEPVPPSHGPVRQATHTKAWAAKIASFDGFVFVTPEYNHCTSGALKNAIDFLYAEWNNKAAGFVGYGSAGGARAVEHLRLVMASCRSPTCAARSRSRCTTDFENYSTFKPGEHQLAALQATLDQVISWSRALRSVREPQAAAA